MRNVQERLETRRFSQTPSLVTEHVYKCRRSLKCRHLLDQCTTAKQLHDAHAKISKALGIHNGSASVVLQLHLQNRMNCLFSLGYALIIFIVANEFVQLLVTTSVSLLFVVCFALFSFKTSGYASVPAPPQTQL